MFLGKTLYTLLSQCLSTPRSTDTDNRTEMRWVRGGGGGGGWVWPGGIYNGLSWFRRSCHRLASFKVLKHTNIKLKLFFVGGAKVCKERFSERA